MTTAIKGLVGEAPTQNEELITWINEAVDLFQPESVVFCDGTQEEWDRLTGELVEAGTLIKLNEEKRPNSFLARSNPADVARVESRTFICSENEEDAGPTNNWAPPAAMKEEMREQFRGSMKGRTMFVVPFCMGPISDPEPKLGVQLTDSAYVVLSMRIMTRMGQEALDKIGVDGDFVPCLHSVGAPLEPGEEDVAWPCNDTKYITHFPETKEIINRENIAKMKDGVVIANLSRADLVKDADIEVALNDGKVAKYVTDFPDASLLDVKNVVAIPHLGASTEEGLESSLV